jgi:hypothetical protein
VAYRLKANGNMRLPLTAIGAAGDEPIRKTERTGDENSASAAVETARNEPIYGS